MSIRDNYRRLVEAVKLHAVACGRDPNSIKIVAVSKGYSRNKMLEVYQNGCLDFGESRLQEAVSKMSENDLTNIQWHFIGTLQKNKVRKTIGKFALIHSVDSIELAEKISDESKTAAIQTPVLLQVNISEEITKHGFLKEQLQQQLDKILLLEGISIKGLMTMAPNTFDQNVIRNCFSSLRNLQQKNTSLGSELSMGMTNDWPIAIEEGATILRIGTAIFDEN